MPPRSAAAAARPRTALLLLLALGLLAACQAPARAAPTSTPARTPGPATSAAPTLPPDVSLPRPPANAERLQVVRVVDGDTFVARLPGGSEARVRLVGVNTPESVKPESPVECFAKEASAYLEAKLRGRTVLAARDVSETDRFGRLLRLVWLEDGTFVNADLVASGHAQAATFPPDVTHADLLRRLERAARESRAGLWGRCRAA